MTTSKHILTTLRQHAGEAYPEECCGFLLGHLDGDACTVEALQLAENTEADERTRRYEITPDAYRRASEKAGREGLDIVGFYHSHPDHPARPSETDLAEATFTGYRYVIASVKRGTPDEVTAWRLRPDRSDFLQEPIQTPALHQ